MGSRHGRALCARHQLDPARIAEPGTLVATQGVGALPSPETVDFNRDALFFDFDGTLAEIAPAPNLVALVPQARDLLQSLVAAFSGAVAIVTGRRISEIDHYLAPLQLPVAGLYGLVRRSADSNIRDATADVASVARASAHLKAFAELHPELLLELKGQTIALHYRTRPELAAKVREAGRAALRGLRDLKLIEGKMVVEIAPSSADKGRAVGEFLDEAPFVGRRPIYCGDDISDEAAFNAVRARGGITVKIGTGPTCAQFRAHNIEELFAWFEAVCKIGPQPE